ncbi:MAG: tetratricopeptide repeat protein [Actinomycetota bacterium]|nr:tetratricopeptide repeat protein [Actinomycetota bacterium]
MTPVMEVDEAAFEAEVLERSREAPVVVDFWAEWCAPCRTLGPVLERLAAEADGAWTLAKVDVDKNPMLAQTFGVRGIPSVKAFKDAHPVAEFTGALPEPQVRAWLQGLGPSPADLEFEDAGRMEAGGSLYEAADGYRSVLNVEPAHSGAREGLARVELALRAEGLDEAELRRGLEANPSDVALLAQLADVEAASGRLEDALERLLDGVRARPEPDREQARRHLVGLMDAMPPEDPRLVSTRRALSRALF